MDNQRNTSIADTGFVVALINTRDQYHERVKTLYYDFNIIVLPQTTLAEIAYLIQRELGSSHWARFLNGLGRSRFQIQCLDQNDLIRAANILTEYKDSRIDFVDASVMVLAERFEITTVLTIDQRDFQIFRPRHCDYFQLLP